MPHRRDLLGRVDLNDGFVLLRDQEAARVGRAQHVDEQLVGQDVKLLHLLALQQNNWIVSRTRKLSRKDSNNWAVVVAQLVERLLPIPEVRGSNPVIGKNLFIYWTFVYCQLSIEKTKIKKKRPGMAHLKKKKKDSNNQCDQMARLCFQFWPNTTMKLCPTAFIILPK